MQNVKFQLQTGDTMHTVSANLRGDPTLLRRVEQNCRSEPDDSDGLA